MRSLWMQKSDHITGDGSAYVRSVSSLVRYALERITTHETDESIRRRWHRGRLLIGAGNPQFSLTNPSFSAASSCSRRVAVARHEEQLHLLILENLHRGSREAFALREREE